jgi:hypothetical protein
MRARASETGRSGEGAMRRLWHEAAVQKMLNVAAC